MVDKNSSLCPDISRQTEGSGRIFFFFCRVQPNKSFGLFVICFSTLLIKKITEAGFLFENVDFPFAFARHKMFAEETGITKVKTVRFR